MIRTIDYLALSIGMALIAIALSGLIAQHTLALLDQVNRLL